MRRGNSNRHNRPETRRLDGPSLANRGWPVKFVSDSPASLVMGGGLGETSQTGAVVGVGSSSKTARWGNAAR